MIPQQYQPGCQFVQYPSYMWWWWQQQHQHQQPSVAPCVPVCWPEASVQAYQPAFQGLNLPSKPLNASTACSLSPLSVPKPKRQRRNSSLATMHTHSVCSPENHVKDLVKVYLMGKTRKERLENVKQYISHFWKDQLIKEPMQCLICEHTTSNSLALADHCCSHGTMDVANKLLTALSEEDTACLTICICDEFRKIVSEQPVEKPFAVKDEHILTPPSSCEGSPEDRKQLPVKTEAEARTFKITVACREESQRWNKQFVDFLQVVNSLSKLREEGCDWCARLTKEDKYWDHVFATHTSSRPLSCVYCHEVFVLPSALVDHASSCDAQAQYFESRYGSAIVEDIKSVISDYITSRCTQLFYPPRLHKSTAWIQKFLTWNVEPLEKVVEAYNAGSNREEKLEKVRTCVLDFWRDQLDSMDHDIRCMRDRESIGPKDTYCVDCEKNFDTPAHFRIHRFGVHHPDKRPLSCLICVSRFAHVQSLWAHLKGHHLDRTSEYFESKLGKEGAMDVAEICCKKMNIPRKTRSSRTT